MEKPPSEPIVPVLPERATDEDILSCDISSLELPENSTYRDVYENSILPEMGDANFRSIIGLMLEQGGYKIEGTKFELLTKQRSAVAKVDTDQGPKFVKLTASGGGEDELAGGKLMADHFPTIRAERVVKGGKFDLVIQPFVADIGLDQGTVTDAVGALEHAKDDAVRDEIWSIFPEIFGRIRTSTMGSMEYTVQPAKNDRFFYDRLKTTEEDGVAGRMERFYRNKKMNFAGQEVSWDELLDLSIKVDGVEYEETLRSLLANAKDMLKPDRERILGLSHGDGHEMNIFTNILSEHAGGHEFAYLDMETAGGNQILPEMVTYLVYNSVMADYTIPKYFPEHFSEKNRALNAGFDNIYLKRREDITAVREGGGLVIDNAGNFGTSKVRKRVAEIYASEYVDPVIHSVMERFGGHLDKVIEGTLKAAILMRLFGVHNVQHMDALDQTKLFSLLYKSVGTSREESVSEQKTICRFLEAL